MSTPTSPETKTVTFKAIGKDWSFIIKRYTAEESFNISQAVSDRFQSQCLQILYGVESPAFPSIEEVKKLDHEVFLQLVLAVGDYNSLDPAFLSHLANLPKPELPPFLKKNQ